MVKRDELSDYLDKLLDCRIYADYTVNGLQIEGREEIHRIVTGVSPSHRLFASAARKKADAIILHHGLFWKRGTPSPFTLTGLLKKRVEIIIKKDINLFAFHLPLDGDDKFGNNVLIGRALGLRDIEILPESETTFPLIAIGELEVAMGISEFFKKTDAVLQTKGIKLNIATNSIRRVAIVTGAGSDCWQDAANHGADILITGEIEESEVRSAEEAGINLYGGGHYNTEKWGVRSLGDHLAAHFDLDVQFVDIPNPI